MVVDALSRKTIFILSLKHCIWKFASDGALLAQLRVISDLRQMMIDAQKNDFKLQQRVQLVRNGDKTDYSIKGDGDLYYKNISYAPNVQEMEKKIVV